MYASMTASCEHVLFFEKPSKERIPHSQPTDFLTITVSITEKRKRRESRSEEAETLVILSNSPNTSVQQRTPQSILQRDTKDSHNRKG